ncbi:hypothetical protein BD289DRAFT_448902 [Coniella lustricola]|uniref:Uncharacterized protein n=1 Tax=Coniella lustricola TaxID=2025994 RepID=A0A2T2ZRR0_9PEZI|nr:hypothetical protein BD289DRAFT_448902 [Coniella lustricola]
MCCGASQSREFWKFSFTNLANNQLFLGTPTVSVSDSTVTAQPRAYNGTTSALEESILYIDTTEGSFAHVGFTDNSTVSSDATTTTGFSYFGTMLTWEDADGDIESSWYAELLDGESKIWKLMWNTDVDIDTDTVIPVVLKNKAPTSD